MKISIGEYPKPLWYSSIYDDYIEQGHSGNHVYRVLQSFLQFTYDMTINAYRYRTNRKVSICIDSSDVFDMRSTLALIIAPLLRKFKEDQKSFGFVDDEDVPEELRNGDDIYDSESSLKKWQYILDNIIWAFEQHEKDSWEDMYYELKSDGSEVVTDADGLVEHYDRIMEGQRLFGKYYTDLWS